VTEATLIYGTHAIAEGGSDRSLDLNHGARLSFFFIWLFMVAIYARPEDIFPVVGQMHTTFILGACAITTFLWALLVGDMSLVFPRELCLMMLLTAWFIMGVPLAYWRTGSFDVLTQVWLKTLLIFFLLTQTLVSLERIRAVLWAIIYSELAITAYSIAATSQVHWISGRMFGISYGILGGNFLGIAAALTIPYIAALFVTHPSFVKSSVLAASTISMLWMLVLTASRSGLLSVVVSMILTSLLVLRGTSRGKIIGVGIVIALLIAVGAAPNVFWSRMATLSSNDDSVGPADASEASAEMSDDHRMAALTRSVNYTLDHPIFGMGLGNMGIASANELGQQVPEAFVGSHNTFTQISSEAGLPALLLFLGLLSTFWRSMKQIGRTEFVGAQGAESNLLARASQASLLSFVFSAFFAHIGYEYFLYTCPIAIGVGIQHVARNMVATSPTTPESSTSTKQSQLTEGWTA
jgi:O-antigen ligase